MDFIEKMAKLDWETSDKRSGEYVYGARRYDWGLFNVAQRNETWEEYKKRTNWEKLAYPSGKPEERESLNRKLAAELKKFDNSAKKHAAELRRMEEANEKSRKEHEEQANRALDMKRDGNLVMKQVRKQVENMRERHYNLQEMMNHYFLGIDKKDRPFDLDGYGLPYYLDVDSMTYQRYTKNNMDPEALRWSNAKRKRLTLPPIMNIDESRWLIGPMIDNSPENIQEIMDQESMLRRELKKARDEKARAAEQESLYQSAPPKMEPINPHDPRDINGPNY